MLHKKNNNQRIILDQRKPIAPWINSSGWISEDIHIGEDRLSLAGVLPPRCGRSRETRIRKKGVGFRVVWRQKIGTSESGSAKI
jgi:hypothetical protein